MITIDILDRSTTVVDEQLREWVAALQIQVSRDFYAAWGVDAKLQVVPKRTPGGKNWQMIVLDNSDVADALGYHDVTRAGLPLGKVFAKTALDAGASVSGVLSHEILEMLGDPDINLVAMVEQGPKRGMYAYEVCDPVQADKDGYEINGVLVSNFVYPDYFESFHTKGRFDHGKQLKKPLTLQAGGYQSVYVPGRGWEQMDHKRQLSRSFAQVPKRGSRRERRRRHRSQWIASVST